MPTVNRPTHDTPFPQCDFCADPNPEWRWACESFKMPEHFWGSVEDWAACATCNNMILHNQWTDLAVRSAITSPGFDRHAPLTQVLVLQAIRDLHNKFRTHRKANAPVRITKPEEFIPHA